MLRVELRVRLGTFELRAAFATGGVLAVMGPNGAGKTTLLRTLLGAHVPTDGRIELHERLLFDRRLGVDVPVEGRRIAYVPQGFGLFPHLSILENVAFGARGVEPEGRRVRARAMLRRLDVRAPHHARPAALSAGQRQRVALARALAAEPAALLLDEPFAALDADARPRIRAFLSAWLRSAGLPTLIVTHDPRDARLLAPQLLILEAGRVLQSGSADELAARPASPYVAALGPELLALGNGHLPRLRAGLSEDEAE